ncbi:MAG: hypothetical protein ACK5WC_03900 [Aphanizomenon sp.]|jgi:hypothetical protein|uniref:Uncharacterized protein n=2 Tax=Aphanizomenon flos-aquae TaxID=1176 RepID=A0A1B7X0N0_APHFL|nr:hypothetical protein [Aphanizomenon flos-aquae UKL13-PB]MBO1059373.1 hypothetical protein [Aphanizomenon flos-aquae CP01]OBQ27133.1 MAG: hypothetical protein AN481_01410 [Aphanizomenon flos-aquae LD13]OBQ31145.1 MAG: hypothetical protein AN483_02125 [Aphanizomenon flos-aquae MDT14a]OBQ42937.1 MAG: hypothetical protein AN484_15000 [Aphanizomenon flos-aquae WA102]QSV65840.1 MAG: hypothetical protein HEQ12_01925 [Aphanizomenon flos-aquae DEX188]HCQ23106.1 hypothetical protein [Anabaena sp. UB
MSKNTQLNHSQLLRYLSDIEQESLVGGQISPMLNIFTEGKLLFQKTDIETEGKNDLTLASGDSTSQTSKYKFSQVTMALYCTFSLLTITASSDKLTNSLPNCLNNFFS